MTAAVPLVERLAEVLRAHQIVATGLGEWCCKCSPTEWRATAGRSDHFARALLPVVEQAVAEARGEAWDEGYVAAMEDSWKREMSEPSRNPYLADAIATTDGAE